MRKRLVLLALILLIVCSMVSSASASLLSFLDKKTNTNDDISRITYISDREFVYYEDENVYCIRFAFLDADQKERLISPCTVKARIVDSDGEIVYQIEKQLTKNDFMSWTWPSALYSYRNGYYATVYVKPEEINAKTYNNTGKMYIEVTLPNGMYFEETEINTEDIPTKPTYVELPAVPVVIADYSSYTNSLNGKIQINKLTYKYDKYSWSDDGTLNFYITGELLAGKGGYTTSISWKLYDEEGYIVQTGNWYTDDMDVGDKFRDKECTIYGIKPGNYKLKITNAE